MQALTERAEFALAEPVLLLLLEGQAVVDLPLGEFRVLERGDALPLAAGTEAAVQPVAGQAILVWADAR